MYHGSEAHGVGQPLNQKWWILSASLEASKVGLGRWGGRGWEEVAGLVKINKVSLSVLANLWSNVIAAIKN